MKAASEPVGRPVEGVGRPAEDAWTPVCRLDRLTPGRGVTALVGGEQVAIFLLPSGEVYAVGNYDPFSRAYVIARGLTGSRADTPTVASPMYKNVFDLRTGACLDDDTAALPTYPVRIRGDVIEVRANPHLTPRT